MPDAHEFELHLEAPFGASQQYDGQWIDWARTADAPAIAGVDASLDPVFHAGPGTTGADPNDLGGEGETRYA